MYADERYQRILQLQLNVALENACDHLRSTLAADGGLDVCVMRARRDLLKALLNLHKTVGQGKPQRVVQLLLHLGPLVASI